MLGDLEGSAYPAPERARLEMAQLADTHADICELAAIGRSSEDRAIEVLWLRGSAAAADSAVGLRPRLLVTAHIHAVEYVGSYVARAVARRLAQGYGRVTGITSLLDRADVCIAALLNPDGAERVWRQNGWCSLRSSRLTANGVDPNRNFPFVALEGRSGWNSGSRRRRSPYYRGPSPLSEPECLALARLCKRERFCAAINFHSFGGVVFMPKVEGDEAGAAQRAFDVFHGSFQSHQRKLRYRPVPERSAAIAGQLDSFLLNAFGTVSVTVEVSRLGLHLLLPWHTLRIFSWANPPDPERWVENDADAAIHALAELLDRTRGAPCAAAHPELADQVPD